MNGYLPPNDPSVRVINLSKAPGAREAWARPAPVIYLWAVFELLFVTNPWQISSGLRVRVLRLFGATIGDGVIFRPGTRVKFPWNLHIGDRSWIGDGVWFHNQDLVRVGHDVTISQETFLTTGSHAFRRDMALITKPVVVMNGAWITSRCIVLGGSEIGTSSLVTPGTVVTGKVPPNVIWGSPPPGKRGARFE